MLLKVVMQFLLLLQEVQSNSQALSRSASLSSIQSDSPRKKGEPAYSFVGMHCIFDQCKAMGKSWRLN